MLGFYIFIVSTLLSVIVGVLVLSQGIRSRSQAIYLILTTSIITLSAANYLSLEPSSWQPFLARTVMASSTAGLYALFLLLRSMRGEERLFDGLYCRLFLVATLATIALAYTPYMFTEVLPGSPARPVFAIGALLYLAHLLLSIGLSIYEFGIGLRSSRKRVRQQYRAIMLGFAPVMVAAPTTGLLLPLLFDYNGLVVLTPVYAFLLVCGIGYAIARHGLFDVKLVAVRSAVYIFSLATLGIVYYFAAYLMSEWLLRGREASVEAITNPVSMILALTLAFLFQPVKNFFDRLSNDIFYRKTYSSEAFYERLSSLLSSTTDLRSILERASTEIAETLKAEQAMFFLYYTNGTNHYISAGTKGHKRMPIADARTLDEFADTLKHENRLIVTDHLIDNEPIRRLLVSHKIALLMPLRYNKRLIGYLTLGDHRGGGYSQRDLRTLTTILNEIVIAIQNALSIQEVREINATLKQRIDVATKELRSSNAQLRRLDEVKDEFISMASHQLRTPLTSVKGYISMVLEGDVGKVTPMQKQLLTEAFNSSERMVRLIGDFLNVSRLQTGKFMIEKNPADLTALVAQEVGGLKVIAASRGQNIAFKKPDDLELIAFDESKMRQVVMNFIDNAIYYSRDNTTIVVTLEKIGSKVEFTVKDTGIGVPKEEQANLFRKFFRATNARKARPDGTGVGLFLAKKVISAHGGSMIFSSKEGEGSVFGFTMPVKQEV